MKNNILAYILPIFVFAAVFTDTAAAPKRNAYGQRHYTVESSHFRIHYHRGLEHLVPRVASKLEELYGIYTETYHIKLPHKTDVVLYESDFPNAFAYPNFNFIYIGVHDYEFNLRGSSDWFNDVLTHEYAHIVSMHTGLKLPPAIPAIQAGIFIHPNIATRFEGLHLLPSETMPIWFLEGIAQYESNRRGADSWDTHRDMIMRTLTISGKTLSWPHMQVFAGRGDDFEKVYNHGFSLIMYMSETYGYEKIVSILRENARITRLSFDGSVRAILGISAQQLYDDWHVWLLDRYMPQIEAIGTQVYGRKISEKGYDNLHPRFSPCGGKIFFISNADNDYSFRNLFSYNLSDTVERKKKIKFEMAISSNYDIHAPSGQVAFVSMKSRKSFQEPNRGGQKTFDLFIDALPPENPGLFSRKTERQVTAAKSVFAASFSPTGDLLAIAIRKYDRFFLAVIDTAGKDIRIIYPHVASVDDFFRNIALPEGADTAGFNTIFALRWSPSGKHIAVDYIDGSNRKIGIYDTLQKNFSVIFDDDKYDRRNPSFNSDGSAFYFSSDKSGIFNIYRYIFDTGALERLTNVSGGAFYPAVCSNEVKLAYSGYDPNGYSIYLIDTMAVLETLTASADSAITPRTKNLPQEYAVNLSNRLNYSRLPRQILAVPTLLAEQLVMSDHDENVGVTHIKGGLVVNFMDPLAWGNIGHEGGAFLLIDLARIFNFIDLNRGLISPHVSYDAGMFLQSRTLPVTVDVEAIVRGIAGEDWFYEESEGKMMKMPYQIRIANVLAGASSTTPFFGLYGQAFANIDRYDVALDLKEEGFGIFSYNLSKGYRLGAMTWFNGRARNSRSNISPTGIAGKLQYNLWQQHSLKEEGSFAVESSMLKEQYDDYAFHQLDSRLLFGTPSPVYPKHDFHLSLGGSYLKPIGNPNIPSFYLPIVIVPGYSFFYKDIKIKTEEGETKTMMYDTVLVTGKGVLEGQLSYRFPLWSGSIDRKSGFLYFDMLYGALNLSAGAGFDNPMDAWDFDRQNWLLSYGAEVRLEAISFNNYPLALKFRWDYGADRAKPETFIEDRGAVVLGGHRFVFSVGFNFDDWGMISVVDYFSPARLKNAPMFRFWR